MEMADSAILKEMADPTGCNGDGRPSDGTTLFELKRFFCICRIVTYYCFFFFF